MASTFLMNVFRRIAIVVFLMFATVANGLAQSCTFTIDDMNFGTVDLTLGTVFQTTGNLVATCSGLPFFEIRLCPSFDAGTGGVDASGDPRYMLNGLSQLNYNIFRNNSYTSVWGSRFWAPAPNPPSPRLTLSALGTGVRTRPVRAQIAAGQTGLPTGTYTSLFSGANTTIAYDYTIVGNCNAIGTNNAVQVPFTVSATNLGACTVSSSTLDFGASTLLLSNIDSTASVSVTCTNGTAYTVGLSDGGTGTGPTNRLMVNGGQQVQYGVYQDSGRSIAWGNTIGTNTVAGTGTGALQTITAYGRVPAQTTPAAATYTDTIVVTLTY